MHTSTLAASNSHLHAPLGSRAARRSRACPTAGAPPGHLCLRPSGGRLDHAIGGTGDSAHARARHRLSAPPSKTRPPHPPRTLDQLLPPYAHLPPDRGFGPPTHKPQLAGQTPRRTPSQTRRPTPDARRPTPTQRIGRCVAEEARGLCRATDRPPAPTSERSAAGSTVDLGLVSPIPSRIEAAMPPQIHEPRAGTHSTIQTST
jgi:hypothetical protein